MNALFLTFSHFGLATGVGKKMQSQIKALKGCGFDKIYFGRLDERLDLLIDDLNLGTMVSVSNFFGRVRHLNQIMDFVRRNNVGFIYHRFNGSSDPEIVVMFRKLRRMGVKMVMEIPTYPYDGEVESKNRFYYLDIMTRNFLSRQFNYIVTFSDLPKIFGQKTINISNGIDFGETPLRQPAFHEGVNLIAVANISKWHGYDRIIRGLAEYMERENHHTDVFLRIVGPENDCVRSLKMLSSDLGVSDRVEFYGEKNGEELDRLFDISDFAIGSLGRHRNNIKSLKTLKNVEYAARGIPFIYSENNDDFDDKPYILKASADESMISIKAIIDFINNNQISPAEIRSSIIDKSWDKQMELIVNTTYGNG